MNRERSEAAYAAYIVQYNAFMAARFESREEIDAAADRVRAGSAAYRAACAQEFRDEEAKYAASPRGMAEAAELRKYEAEVRIGLVFEAGAL
jgi:hypothetical protein